jgi:hypothetical protein
MGGLRQGVARQPGGRAHPRWAARSVGGLRGRPGEIKVPKTPQRPRPTVGRPLKRSANYRHTDIQPNCPKDFPGAGYAHRCGRDT